MTEGLLILVGLGLIGANALFVAAEFAFVTVDRATVDRAADSGDRVAGGVQSALRGLSTQLSGAQLGITVTSLALGFVLEPSLASLLRPVLEATGLPAGGVPTVSIALALTVATAVQMVLGELLPKNWAIAEPLRVARRVQRFHRGFTTVTGPLLRVLNGSANQVLRLLGIEPREELASARTPSELASLSSRSAARGALDDRLAALLDRSLRFSSRTAADVMTPRPQLVSLTEDEPVAAVLVKAAGTGLGRFPVRGKGIDDVVGVVHFKHALAVPVEERDRRQVREVLQEVPAVPETLDLAALLPVLRGPGLQLALVVDEYGGTAGVATFEDLVEEIVGNIFDEQDARTDEGAEVAEQVWEFSGLSRPDEVGRTLDLELPEPEDSDTVSGLLAERLDRVPEVGDVAYVEARDLRSVDDDGLPRSVTARIDVVAVDGRRVDRVRVTRQPPPEPGVDQGEAR